MNVHVKQDPLELPVKERLAAFQRELAQTPPEDRPALVRRYLDPNAITRLGAVTIAQGRKVVQTSWRNSATEPGTTDGTIREMYDTGHFDVVAPKKRTNLERMDSMIVRLVDTWRSGNAPLLDGLLAQCFPDRWKPGTPISEDSLRMLAAQSLAIAAAKQAEREGKQVTA